MRLTDCFMDIIAYVAYFLKSADARQPSYDQVRADILSKIAKSESCLENGSVSREDYNLARFAVFAWTDEAIMASSWEGRTQWQREKLQRLYYQTDDAGELFFERMNAMGVHQRDVLEIYYICLGMGFKGQYCGVRDEILLEGLKDQILKILTGSSLDISSPEKRDLFPEAYPGESSKRMSPKPPSILSNFTLICLSAPVVIFGVLFLLYRFFLEERVGDIVIGF